MDVLLERVVLMAILGVALLMRLVDLGARPLQPEESDLAVRSLLLSRGEAASLAGNGLLVNANAGLVFMFGSDDGVVRLFPALAGVALVWLAWTLHPWLGRVGAIAAAALLAVSPTVVYLSRSANSAMLAVGLAMALVALAVRYQRERQTWQVYALAVVAGLLLTAGPLAWMALLSLAVALIVWHAVAAPLASAERLGVVAADWSLEQKLPTWLPEPAVLRRALGLGALVAVLVATGLLTNLRGVQTGLIDSISLWWASVATVGETGPTPRWYYALYLISYDAAAILVGVPAAVALARREGSSGATFARFLALWAVSSLALTTIAAQRDPEGALLTVLPLLLLAGAWTNDFAAWLWSEPRAAEVRRQLGVFVAGTAIVVGLTWVGVGYYTLEPTRLPEAVVLTPIFGGAFLVVAGLALVGARRTLELGALIAALLAVGITLHASFNLNFRERVLAPHELVAERATSPDVRNLARDVDHVLQVLSLAGLEESIAVEERHRPLLAWYLKDIPGVRFEDRVTTSASVVILSPDATPPRGPYAGQTYQLTQAWRFEPTRWEQWWRWWAQRESAGPLDPESVVVYVKSQAR